MYFLDGLAPAFSEEEASIRFICTGYRNEKKEPLFISMDRTGDAWSGGRTGTMEELQELFREDAREQEEERGKKAEERCSNREDAPPAEKEPHMQAYGPSNMEAETYGSQSTDGSANKNSARKETPRAKKETPASGNKIGPAAKHTAHSPSIQVKDTAKISIPKDVLVQEQSWTTKKQDMDAFKYYVDCACTNAYAKGSEDSIIANGKEEYVINTGIMDKFGHDIYICFHVSKKGASAAIDRYEPITGKSSLLRKGFSKEDARKTLVCAPLYAARSDLDRMEYAKMEDFELSDRPTLEEMLQRKRRLLESLNMAITPYDLSSHLEKSIEMGLRISQMDPGYIRPCYDLGTAQIHYLIPLHMAASVQEPAELMTEVRFDGEFFLLHDLLTPEEAYLKAKAIAPYSTAPA